MAGTSDRRGRRDSRVLVAGSPTSHSRTIGRWGETFCDDVAAAAMIDRLVHHAEVLTLTGDSWIPTGPVNAVYVGDETGRVYALDAATGEQRWTYEVSDGDYYPDGSVVADGVVYLDDDGENVVHALDAATGEQRWTYETGSGIYRPVVADGVVYISTSSDKVHAVRAATG